ncbi:hypothetical protein NEMIN01_2365, partial [Nematocida minor]|uniref:uncharacterized protein n=1 Tax=Nematocida minor TaxID=1912983 RepID=UPI0022207117
FSKDNPFVKLVRSHLKEKILVSRNDSFTLASIIEYLVSPVESRKMYTWGGIFFYLRICIPLGLASHSDDILSILLTFIDLENVLEKDIFIQNAKLSGDFKFSKFKYFSSVRRINLENVSLHSNTFKDMEFLKALKDLRFSLKTKLEGNTDVKVNIASLESLTITELEEEEIKHFLRSTDDKCCPPRLSVKNVNLSDTEEFSRLSYLSSLITLNLCEIVFKEVPDFTFIKKTKAMKYLGMLDIFYGYAEKYEESSFSQIRKNVNYLNQSQTQKKYDTYSEKEKKIIEENRKIGEAISIEWIDVNKNLYHDLGISNLRTYKKATINLIFPFLKGNNSTDVDLYNIGFFLGFDQEHIIISSRLDSKRLEKECIPIISGLELPFSSCISVKNIHLQFYHENEVPEEFTSILMRSTYLYSQSNEIERIYAKSTSKANIDMNAVIECGKHFKELISVDIEDCELSQTSIKSSNKIGVDDTPEYVVSKVSQGTQIYFITNP